MQPQPYSELANWDGALSARVATSASASSSSPPEHHTPSDPDSANLFGDVSVMVDSLSPPSPPDSTLINKVRVDMFCRAHIFVFFYSPFSQRGHHPIHIQIATTVTLTLHRYTIYTTNLLPNLIPNKSSQPVFFFFTVLALTQRRQVNRQNPHTSTSDSSSVLGASNSLFPSNGHESVLSPKEREIMEDITLDPDDPAAWPSAANDASLSKKDAKSRSLQVSTCLPFLLVITFVLSSQDRRLSRQCHGVLLQPHSPSRQPQRPSLLRPLPHRHRSPCHLLNHHRHPT